MSLEIKENELLKNHSTFRIGGAARYFVVAKSKEEIMEAIEFAKGKNLPFFVFGGGSNMLFLDEGFAGVAIKIKNLKLEIKNSCVEAGAGVLFSQLIMKSAEAGLTGLEWGIGIPGTVGGGVAGNCGAYGHSISESVENVSVLREDSSGGWRIKKYSNQECEFCYRGSRFKNRLKAGGSPAGEKEIILEIEFKLESGDKEKGMEEIKNILLNRNMKIPRYPSIGSIFKNIVIDELENKEDFLKLIPQEKIKGGKFPAAYLMEKCGLSGMKIGGAQISEQHPNFIVNVGEGRAADVLELIKICKEKVKEKFNLDLEEEIIVL